jgi:outer membrane protein OmpU
MRKILVATTALAGIGLMAGTAKAAEPIKLEIGGFMNQWFGVIFMENDTAKSIAPASQIQNNNFGVVSDTEIHFKGSTTLDNGLKVSVVVEHEAERTTHPGAAGTAGGMDSTARNANQQYVVLSSGFGELSLGERADVQHRVHNTAPRFGAGTDIQRSFLLPRAAHNAANQIGGAFDSTSVDAISNAGSTKIDYVSPSFYGLAMGVGYTPTVGGRGTSNERASTHDLIDAALVYTREVGDFKLGADVGYAQAEYPNSTSGSIKGVSSGLKVSYAGFTVGGSHLRVIDSYHDNTGGNLASVGGYAWDAGISYETGPYGVSFTYFTEGVEASTSSRGRDTVKNYSLAGKYTMGPGVDLVGGVHHARYKDETNTDLNNTSGWAVISGINLTF